MMTMRLGTIVAVAAVAATAACSEPCVQMSEVTVIERFVGGPDTIAFFRIRVVDEASGPDFLGWSMSAWAAEGLTAVHLHARPAPGMAVATILSFPLEPGVQHPHRDGEYDLTVPIEELMSTLRDTSAYLDFHTVSRPEGMMRTRLLVVTDLPLGKHCF